VVDYPRPDLRAAAEHIESRAPPGTRVIEPVVFNFGRSGPLTQDLAIHLDDEYPLSNDLYDLGRQPQAEDFYVVLPHPAYRGPVDKVAEAAGAKLLEARVIDGLHDVFVRRYTR
jgi:hypothetical protein